MQDLSPRYERLLQLAERENELAREGTDLDALEAIAAERAALVASLPTRAPREAGRLLSRLQALQADTSVLLDHNVRLTQAQLGRLGKGRGAVRGYTPPPRPALASAAADRGAEGRDGRSGFPVEGLSEPAQPAYPRSGDPEPGPPLKPSAARADQRGSTAQGWVNTEPASMEDRPKGLSSVNLFDTTQISLERAISGAALRQATLTGNVANANTPGYRRQDVDFHAALRGAMAGGDEAIERVSFSAEPDASALMRTDGNGVDIDVESANLARNGLEYDGLVSVTRSRNDIMRSAMGVA